MSLCTEILRDERGQALTEAPIIIVTLCVLALILFQPVVTLYTKMVLGAAAASLCRVVATDSAAPGSGEDASATERLLQTYAEGKIAGLPQGSAFQVPGSLRLETTGDAHAQEVSVRLSLDQKALPFLGLLVGARRDGTVEVSAEAHSVGALAGADLGADYEYSPVGQVPW